MNILAIDPGSTESGWVIMDADTYKPLAFGKTVNRAEKYNDVEGTYDDMYMVLCDRWFEFGRAIVVIEDIASYGMPVGKEVFDTCKWIGRFSEYAEFVTTEAPRYITRKDEKMTICGSMKAKDANIRRALIDRFATHDMKNGKGTKDNPDWFYGFKADIWQAYAVGVTWADMQKEK